MTKSNEITQNLLHPNLNFNTCSDGTPTTSLDNLLYCSTTHTIKKNILYFQSNPTFFHLKMLPLLLSFTGSDRKYSPSYNSPLHIEGLQQGVPRAFFSLGWVSQPIFMGEMLQHSDDFHLPPLYLLQHVHVFCWEGPSSMHCCRCVLTRAEEREENHLPRAADHTSFYITYNIVHFLATGKVYVQFFTHHYAQVFPYRDAFISFLLQSVTGQSQPRCRTLCLACWTSWYLHGDTPQACQASLAGIPSLTQISCPTQLAIICRLADSAPNPRSTSLMKTWIVLVSVWTSERHDTLMKYTWMLNSSDMAIQSFCYPSNSPSAKHMLLKFSGIYLSQR